MLRTVTIKITEMNDQYNDASNHYSIVTELVGIQFERGLILGDFYFISGL